MGNKGTSKLPDQIAIHWHTKPPEFPPRGNSKENYYSHFNNPRNPDLHSPYRKLDTFSGFILIKKFFFGLFQVSTIIFVANLSSGAETVSLVIIS